MGLALDAVSKVYGSVEVLAPTSLAVADGEFLTLLGPSGSGKTTILRLVGGFVEPTAGTIRFGSQDLAGVPTNRRPFNTVFQDYALFPHMSVADNVGYGLMVRRRPASEIRAKIAEALGVVDLAGLAGRFPSQLSGGQRQRVALARAIVCEPKLILLDEPLAALDAALRRQMQTFLKALQRRIATTFLFVTHDQEEAITMSDRIVVMNRGAIEQTGTPRDLYYAPRTRFVAGFFGDNNLLAGTAAPGRIETELGALALAHGAAGAVTVAVRPERVVLGDPPPGALAVPCRVEDVVFVGATSIVRLRPDAAPGRVLVAKLASDRDRVGLEPGSAATAAIRPADCTVIADGGR